MRSTNPTREKQQSLWLLIGSPSIWGTHFMLSYITAAIWCEKMAGPNKDLGQARNTILIYTVLAVTGIIWIGWIGFKKHSFGNATLPHDEDTPEDRHRFLGFSTLLLSGLSLIAVLFEALVLAFVWKCH